MSDTYSRMLFSLFSHNFVTTNVTYNLFKDIITRIDKAKEENDRISYNKNIVQKDELEPFIEWLLVSIAKYVARMMKPY